ncbi:unnamed protein product [Cyprideis torosa]|uniref:Uncharacterized protein n=1 Tax=Cyprideis torosa TaxID=163714 RepID=A0A7R8ZM83_9CRUS|nr:unnamed protein product [Cyprideis torosa]CAG0883752.1 unnamed protein product [Cyprideis torosa]
MYGILGLLVFLTVAAPFSDAQLNRGYAQPTNLQGYNPPSRPSVNTGVVGRPVVGAQQTFVNTIVPGVPTVTPNMPNMQTIEVACSKEEMVVRIKFDRVFNGVIYSKGFYNNPACQFVRSNSGRDQYEFQILRESCGTQLIDNFQTGGQAYLENVIIFQNEPGIQEVWDQARRLRCLWQGNIDKVVTYAFNVDMLDQEIVTFSGDTANAVMDVQIGKGPFAPSVSGLVKIGDTMTIVISVEGDPGFDVHVKDCIAHPGDRNNAVQLTDTQGCILKPKLMSAPFVSTTQTGGTGATVIAYAFFQAFKFPDQMDVFLECNIELCKGTCPQCPTSGAAFGGRKKRHANNETEANSDPVRLARTFRVLAPDDISVPEDLSKLDATITLTSNEHLRDGDFCMSTPGFVIGLVCVLLILVVSCVFTASLCVKVRAFPNYSSSPFHPFSTASGLKA